MGRARRLRVGILDHASRSLGGAQYVNACMAEVLSELGDVELIHGGRGYTLSSLRSAFGMDLKDVRERIREELIDGGGYGLKGIRQLSAHMRECRLLTHGYDLFIYSGMNMPPMCNASRGIAYIHFPMDAIPLIRGNGWPRVPGAIMQRIYYKRQIGSYSKLFANSAFTAYWIEKRWGQTAQVLFPPVDVAPIGTLKRNAIVSLGRFTGGKRKKHQLEQVETFRRFLAHAPGWELFLIGFCSEQAEDRDYLARVQRAAEGLPVRLLLGSDRRLSEHFVSSAKLFWHTAGFENDERRTPEMAEHFGIATVEAMRMGTVPVVIASGGQREIIEPGVSGYLCYSLDDLLRHSLDLARDSGRLEKMSKAALWQSSRFSKSEFQNNFRSCVIACLSS